MNARQLKIGEWYGIHFRGELIPARIKCKSRLYKGTWELIDKNGTEHVRKSRFIFCVWKQPEPADVANLTPAEMHVLKLMHEDHIINSTLGIAPTAHQLIQRRLAKYHDATSGYHLTAQGKEFCNAAFHRVPTLQDHHAVPTTPRRGYSGSGSTGRTN